LKNPYSRAWIPPYALIFAQFAHGASWALVLWAAWSGNLHNPMYGLAWVHTAALGWITMAALAILTFALPNFIDARWRGLTLARRTLALFGIGVVLQVYAFLNDAALLWIAGTILAAALLVYLGTAFATAAAGMRGERVQRAVARAFGGTLLFLLATALLGLGLAFMLSGKSVAPWIAASAPAHANLGTLGWLSLLVFGVSMRTLRPIAGNGTRFRWMHIAVGSLALLGIPLLAAGTAAHVQILAWIGGALFAAAAGGYAFDVLDILRRATVAHRPPQAFVGAAICWLLIVLALGAGVLQGRPWQSAYAFALLAGWIGQMVNAHIHHIGIRLLSTIYRGEDDETQPGELLEARLSWFSFFAFQIAVAIVTAALIRSDAGLAARGAVFGLAAWTAMAANIFAARLRAKSYSAARPIE